MSKKVEVLLHFDSPIERNNFAAVEIHKAEVTDIKMGHDEVSGYWIKYNLEEE